MFSVFGRLPPCLIPLTSFLSLASVRSMSSSTAAANSALLKTFQKELVILKPLKEHKSTIIWMHGLGDSSAGFQSLFEQHIQPRLPHTRVVLPNAPMRPITVNGGMTMRAWYDIISLDRGLERNEDRKGIDESHELVHALIAEERRLLDSAASLCVGGFSQGAAMAMHSATQFSETLAGVVACSGYVVLRSGFSERFNEAQRSTPFLAYSGVNDQMVPISYARQCFDDARCSEKLNLEWHEENDMDHEITLKELQTLLQFFAKIFA